MSRDRNHNGRQKQGFPRVSGDEPYGEMSDTDMAAFSPRERG